MAEIIQYQDEEEFSSNTTANESRLPSREEQHGATSRTNRTAIHKATKHLSLLLRGVMA
jgi:hypothetical protein